MNRTRTLRVVALSMVIAILAVFMMAFTVSAHPASSYVPNAGPCSSVPVSNIQDSKKTHLANYHPNSLKVKVSSKLSLCLNNKTNASQSVTIMGQVLVTIPAHGEVGLICKAPNKTTFSLLSNPKAALNVTCTA